MRKIKKVTLIVLLCLCTVIGISDIYAYMTAFSSKVNRLNIGSVDTTITEQFTPIQVTPGSVVYKKPSVHNETNTSCFVRMKVLFSDSRMEDFSTVDYNNTDWDYDEDGYWYYKKVLDGKDDTSPLFTQIKISEDINELQNLDVIVYCESIQQGDEIDYEVAWNRFIH